MSAISKLIFNGASHYVTSNYGARGSIKTSGGTTSSFHNGTDYSTNGKKIAQYAIEDGYVFAAQKASDGALYVWVIYPRIEKAFLHYHLDSYKVKAGQKVQKGTLLGYTGKTGKATGIHLHLGIRSLSKLSDSRIKSMTWDALRSCSYVDPEKVSYTAPAGKTTVTNPTSPAFTSYKAKVNASSLNMRAGAGTSYSRIALLSKGEQVTVTGVSGSWSKITYGGKVGWVSSQYLTKVTTPTKQYYGRYNGSSTQIDAVFLAIGVPKAYCGSWKKRMPVAKANGISAYIGTGRQNSTLINLAKSGKLVKP